jgi:preprotein translocase subunit SecD
MMLLPLIAMGQPVWSQAEVASATVDRDRSGLRIAGTAFSPGDIASVTTGYETYSGLPHILITFTETGRAKFALVQQGRLGQPLEIDVDGEVVSSPILREIITGNQVTILAGSTLEETVALARRIAPPGRLVE